MTELCNRKCGFCPRAYDYPNKNLYMSIEVANEAIKQVKPYTNYISLCGLGEPLLAKNFLEILELCVKHKTHARITTNGDKLDDFIDEIHELIDLSKPYTKQNKYSKSKYGLAKLQVNSYDNIEQHKERIKKWGHYKGIHFVNPIDTIIDTNEKYESLFGGKVSNKAGTLMFTNQTGIESPCNILFYKTFINWNGDVNLCSQKWYDQKSFGNILKVPFKKIWEGPELNEYRKKLTKFGGRCTLKDCMECDSMLNHKDGERNFINWKKGVIEKFEY